MMLIEMFGYRRVNYYELCRLCTSSEGNKTHIFNEEGKKRQLPTKIQACLRLQVSEEDSLPKIICNLCLEKLEGFFDFRMSCVKAEGMLESYAMALRFNSDFKKEGKVYVRDVTYNKDGLEDDSINRLDVVSAPLPPQEIHVQLQPTTPLKVSSKPQSLTSIPVPVSIDNLSSFVQTAAIQIVSQHDSDDARLHQYKVQMQSNADTTTHGDHNYSFQTPIQSSHINKQNQTLSSKNMKSASTQMDDHHISNTVQEVEMDNDSLHSAITFTTNNSGQNVLLHFGLTKDKDHHLYQQSEENDSR